MNAQIKELGTILETSSVECDLPAFDALQRCNSTSKLGAGCDPEHAVVLDGLCVVVGGHITRSF
jgi:hypothetical protein